LFLHPDWPLAGFRLLTAHNENNVFHLAIQLGASIEITPEMLELFFQTSVGQVASFLRSICAKGTNMSFFKSACPTTKLSVAEMYML
jgi:hypothetical protein